MKISILIAFFVLYLSSAVAQSNGRITGNVLQNKKPAEGATVSLLRAKDTATVKLSVANREGLYVFENIPDGRYLVSVTAVGYGKALSAILEVTPQQPSIAVPELALAPVGKDLAAVTVTAKRPLVENRIDRTII